MMPLSEDEQRILREIEENLSATDPKLVQQVSDTTLYRHSARVIKWSVVGFLGGLALPRKDGLEDAQHWVRDSLHRGEPSRPRVSAGYDHRHRRMGPEVTSLGRAWSPSSPP